MGQVRQCRGSSLRRTVLEHHFVRYARGAAVTGQLSLVAAMAHKVRFIVLRCCERDAMLPLLAGDVSEGRAPRCFAEQTAVVSCLSFCCTPVRAFGALPLCCRLAVVYDEIRRRAWSERANNNDDSLNLESEAAEIDRGTLMEAEAKYDALEVPSSARACLARSALVLAPGDRLRIARASSSRRAKEKAVAKVRAPAKIRAVLVRSSAFGVVDRSVISSLARTGTSSGSVRSIERRPRLQRSRLRLSLSTASPAPV